MEHKLLKPYRTVLNRLTLFIKRYDKHPNKGNKVMILNILEHLKEFDTSIRLNADDVDMAMAYKLKRKMITYFDQCISAFVSQRDFTKEIESVKGKLTETITIEEVNILSTLSQIQKSDTQNKQPKPTKRRYSALEWATIFYYANESKLLPENPTIKGYMKQFLKDHSIETTYSSLRKKYYEAKKGINKEDNYPIHKLEKIIPFIKEHYPTTVIKVENDIIFLKENNSDY